MSDLSQVPEEEEGVRSVDGEQEYLVTIHLVGYGKPEQVKEEYAKVLERVLGLEFGNQVSSWRITPLTILPLP